MKHRKLRRRIAWILPLLVLSLAVGSLIAASAMSGSTSSAQTGTEVTDLPDVAPPKISDPPSDAELRDLETVAAHYGISIEAAIERYAWNDNFALVVADIRASLPDAFAGAEIVDATNAWISFKGDIPSIAYDFIATFTDSHDRISVEMRSNAGFSEAELVQAIAAAHYAVLEQPEVRTASTSHDFGSGVITTIAVIDENVPNSVLEEFRIHAEQQIVNSTRTDILNQLDVSLIRSERPIIGGLDNGSEHLGGEALTTCTSGFGVKKSGTTERGVLTSGHCDNAQSDDGDALTFKAEHEGWWGDFQWHTGPDGTTDDFYGGSSTSLEQDRRDVSGTGTAIVGMTLCKNGKTNFKDCQEVRKLNVCNGTPCRLVQMGERLAAGGDSGGPVYYGNTAYGLHQGWEFDPIWPYDRDLFSPTNLIASVHPPMGIYVANN